VASLIFGNITEDDILLRDILEELARKHPEQFKLYYTLNNVCIERAFVSISLQTLMIWMKPPEEWTQGRGFVTPQMISEHLPEPHDDHLIVMCGPTPMMKAMTEHLQKLGYEERHYFEF
jgi:cytochrome-b5 reductase